LSWPTRKGHKARPVSLLGLFSTSDRLNHQNRLKRRSEPVCHGDGNRVMQFGGVVCPGASRSD
jgi:hypothetical protein